MWELGGKLRIWELREKWSRKRSEGSPDVVFSPLQKISLDD